jgi:hypothetical protein
MRLEAARQLGCALRAHLQTRPRLWDVLYAALGAQSRAMRLQLLLWHYVLHQPVPTVARASAARSVRRSTTLL